MGVSDSAEISDFVEIYCLNNMKDIFESTKGCLFSLVSTHWQILKMFVASLQSKSPNL